MAETDIFLSHSYADREQVREAAAHLRQMGFSVFVDWEEKPELDRSQVTRETAEWLATRMRQCRGLVYAVSGNTPQSRWMPWELGFFHGFKNRIFILPLDEGAVDFIAGQEYLSLYPVITGATAPRVLAQLHAHALMDPMAAFQTDMWGARLAEAMMDPYRAISAFGEIYGAYARLLSAYTSTMPTKEK